ncbi:epoxide hydrolase N-terminal domain-containing protein [Streptomyces scabiei]|uniref:epoxide hydrolase N-terminal domain-containing protein n=1 Tax=Streptomyces scabiei TaxID=1930 RepID=UPI003678343B
MRRRTSTGSSDSPSSGDRHAPFTIDVPQADLDDLRQRLLRSRLFDTDLPRAAGVPTGYLRELVTYWAEKFAWRAAERRTPNAD